ncbi:MAG: glycosyl hydrolase family 28-related protein [Ktedonobacterales bacterium]
MPYTSETFANNVVTTVAGGAGGAGTALAPTDTTLLLPSGVGAGLPTSGPCRMLLGTLTGAYEIVTYASRSGDTLSGLVRGLEGTTALTWAFGTTVQQAATAGSFAGLYTAINQGRTFNVKDYGAKGDGTTVDDNAIASALSIASGTGGVVYFPVSAYKTASTISVQSDNIVLRGDGWGTIIRPATGANFDVISTPIPATQGTAGYIRKNLVIENMQIDCTNMTGTTAGQGNAIHWYGVQFGKIHNVYINKSQNWGILLDGDSTNFGYWCSITGNLLNQCAGHLRMTSCESNRILDNTFNLTQNTQLAALQPAFGTQSQTAYVLYINSGYAQILGNVIKNSSPNANPALFIDNSGPCMVYGNKFDTVTYEAIQLNAGGHSIVGNLIDSASNVGSTAAVKLSSSGNTITGNIWTTSGIGGGAAHWTFAIQEGGARNGNVIVGNQLLTGTSGVLGLNSASTNLTVKGNGGWNPQGAALGAPNTPTVSNATTGGTVVAGTYQVKVTYVNSRGETLGSGIGSTTTTTGTSTITVTSPAASGDATGWYAYVTQAGGSTYTRQQSAGSPTAIGTNLTLTAPPTSTGAQPQSSNTTGVINPSVPASGTAQVNTFQTDCNVYVSGGTVSNIAVNGTNTGLTSGAFRIYAGGSITLAYTVAPSWLWVGE